MATHSLSASDGKLPRSVVLDPKVGGAIKEELHDGTKANWGIITEWNPSQKLAITWHLRHPEKEQTHVSVEFNSVGGSTRIRLVHSGWGAMGDDAASSREQYQSGWDVVLTEYAAKIRA